MPASDRVITYRRANRQYVAMDEDEAWQFIDQQRVMFVGFVDTDGYPHVTPVWFVRVDHRLLFRAKSNKVKARLANDAPICCAIEDGERFDELRGVMIRGRSRIVDSPEAIRQYNELKAIKYAGLTSRDLSMPAAWASAQDKESLTHIEVSPQRISSWDNRKLDQWTE